MKDFLEDEIYPLSIVADRYSGCFSGGAYTAWNLDHYNLPSEIDDDDVTCYDFWSGKDCQRYVIGKGRTVSEALADLYIKLKARTNNELQRSVEYT